jgi:hypothetical protein
MCELIPTKFKPSLHFESCFSGIQLLVVDEPSPLACGAHNIFGETPVWCRALMLDGFCDILTSYYMNKETLFVLYLIGAKQWRFLTFAPIQRRY